MHHVGSIRFVHCWLNLKLPFKLQSAAAQIGNENSPGDELMMEDVKDERGERW